MAASFPLHADLAELETDAEVVYLPDVEDGFADVRSVERPTSPIALAIFVLGLVAAILFMGSAPALSGLALVAGIVVGGIVNAPAGRERRHTIAALGVPALGLLALTGAFVSSI